MTQFSVFWVFGLVAGEVYLRFFYMMNSSKHTGFTKSLIHLVAYIGFALAGGFTVKAVLSIKSDKRRAMSFAVVGFGFGVAAVYVLIF